MTSIIDKVLTFLSDYPWILIALISHLVITGTVAYLILLERKVASWVQDRIGPNRVGPMGLLQPIADGVKFILKEDYRAAGVDKILFTLAPMIMILVIIVSIATIPWGGVMGRQVARLDVTKEYYENPSISEAIYKANPLPPSRQIVGNILVQMNSADGVTSIYTVDQAGRFVPKEGGVQTPPFMPVKGRDDVFVTYDYGWYFQAANLNIGVLFIIAVLSLAVYGVVLGGWASNNKYSFLGALRATAQMISYEIPLGLSLLTIVVMFGTLDLNEIVDKQAHYWLGIVPAWNVFVQPAGFLMFLICIHAEANRAPFDMAEAEQELVGGYHTEYSAMRFALFFLAEYAGMITTAAVCVALFFGGWHFPGLTGDVDKNVPSITSSFWICLIRAIVFFTKTMVIIFVFMWTRWSLPRFRFDQLMMLAWRAMIPISLALLIATAVVIYWFGPTSHGNMMIGGRLAAALCASNVVVILLTAFVSKIIPAAPETNRKAFVPNSRFTKTPVASRV